MPSSTNKVPQRGRRHGREAWVKAAKQALITDGIETVKIERLAKSLEALAPPFITL